MPRILQVKMWNCSIGLLPKYGLKQTLISPSKANNLRSLTTVNNNNRYEYSYVCGPGNIPLLGMTVGQLLQKAADNYGDHEAVVSVHENIRRSYHQLLREADKLAAGFVSLKLERGDRIGIWGPNSYYWYLTQWAAARAGLVLVNINPLYQPMELKYALNKVGVKAIVAAEEFRQEKYYEILKIIIPELEQYETATFIESRQVPSLRNIVMISQQQRKYGPFAFCVSKTGLF